MVTKKNKIKKTRPGPTFVRGNFLTSNKMFRPSAKLFKLELLVMSGLLGMIAQIFSVWGSQSFMTLAIRETI